MRGQRVMRASVRATVGLAFALLPGLGAAQDWAQDWAMSQFDDGSFFSATLAPVDGPGPALVCGERSPQGVSPAVTGNTEPDITPPGAFRVYISDRAIGAPGAHLQTRDDVLLVAGDDGFRLRGLRWNDLFSTWELDLPETDPAFAAIAGQDRFELRSDRGNHVISAMGFGEGVRQLSGYCRAMFAAVGRPWPQQGAAGARGVTMRQAAEADIRRGCGGPASWTPEALKSANIDGDGAEDIVLDWREVTCSGYGSSLFCGAAMCSADLYISALYPRRGKPESWLAQGLRIQPLSNGMDGVVMGSSLASCSQIGLPGGCESTMYWNGTGLAPLR
ncbi:hypothetical protein E1832_02075 [Antarcticimicrobium luteum]|uniref:Uncharacterized protein n=2 Tax=Antarcticimicrobium luteum TaxID=2547397 RepID=A0A4R5VGD9_9RHOB|nr:hypothetical protein E1832_02075 [Antarcticimicrobium luteum]